LPREAGFGELDHAAFSSGGFVSFGLAARFLGSAFLRLFFVGVSGSAAAAFSSATRLGATPARAALSATSPNFVVGA